MENNKKIVWEYTLTPNFDVCARVGYSTTSEEIGTYGDNLLREQKELLTRYISSVADNGLELKLYLNEEIAAFYDQQKEDFYNNTGFYSWSYNEETHEFTPPVPRPKDGKCVSPISAKDRCSL